MLVLTLYLYLFLSPTQHSCSLWAKSNLVNMYAFVISMFEWEYENCPENQRKKKTEKREMPATHSLLNRSHILFAKTCMRSLARRFQQQIFSSHILSGMCD